MLLVLQVLVLMRLMAGCGRKKRNKEGSSKEKNKKQKTKNKKTKKKINLVVKVS